MYCALRRILDIILAPTILAAEIDLLRVLIAEYLERRTNVFGGSLKNKHHHLVHYPRIISQFGPIVRYWCLRFEQKHQRYKRLMHIACNFKNVPKTIATRHQNDFALKLASCNDTQCRPTQCSDKVGSGKFVKLSDFYNSVHVAAVMHIPVEAEVYQAEWVKINGTVYKSNCYLHGGYDTDNEVPVFVQLKDIFVRNQTPIVFYCEKMNVLGFDDHFHAWRVQHTWPTTYVCIDPYNLTYYLPHSLQSVTLDGTIHDFLSLRHRV